SYGTVDMICIGLCLLILIRAWYRGIFAQLYSVVSMILSIVLTYQLYQPFYQWFYAESGSFLSTRGIQGALILYCILRLLFFLIGRLIRSGKKKGVLSFVNRMAGLALGLVEVVCLVSIWMSVCDSGLIRNGKEYKEQSIFSHIGTLPGMQQENSNGK
ncbi:MAG: CvpA family protein, partial [Erysipelotrichaceae bacterium]|nr:CvpA family protein [Erysipelotrichaceae bacterium]